MSSAPTQLAVAPTASALATSTAQIQKDFLEEPLARQNSLGNRARGSAKPKHLQRSHAMRESTSPPRTPTPRSDHLATSPVSAYSSTETINDSKMHVQSSSLSTSPSLETSSVMVSSQHPQQQTHSSVVMYSTNENNTNCGVVCNQSQLDVDFPKLTPPKSSKCSRNANSNRDLGDKSSNTSENNKQAFNTSPNGMNNTDSVQAINISNGKKNNESMKSNGQTNINNNNNNAPLIANNNNQAALTPSSHQNRMHHQSPPNEHCGNNNAQSTMMVNNCNQQMSPCPVMSSYDKENHCPRNDSQNTNSSSYTQEDNQNSMSESPTDTTPKGDRLGKKHRSGANSKGSKPRLKNMGSSSSMDGGNSTSGFISRDSSMEQFTDQSGVDLLQFFKETLNKNPIDRTMLMKIEKELIDLAHDKTTREIKFPAASSYNRMLIHRVAAFFGMEHNVDNATQQCVIVATTKSTRIPDIRFKSLCRERLSDEPRKSILKRDAHSFDDPRQSFLICPERGVLDRKSKSFEEREEEYEKARRRIFRPRDGGEMGCEDSSYWLWSSSDSSDQSARFRQNNKLLKVQSLSVDSRSDGRPSVSKSHSFGGYGGPPSCGPLARGDSINSTKSAGPRLFSKQDSVGSTNTPWRLSPSSSGYKTQTQSLRSDSVTPSPTGYGSDDHTPEPSLAQSPPIATCGIVWAVTDMASVPRGSVLINPQTLQPIVNQDGSIYHFDPSNLPPSQAVAPGMMYSNKNLGTTTMHRKKVDSKKSSKSEASLTDSCSGPTTTTESSIETLSESSAQTVVLNAGSREDSEEIIDIAKENHIRREMGDIQEESVNNSLDESDKPPTNSDEIVEIEQKPKLKNQATSPNIPFTEPNEQITQAHEAETNNGTTDSTENQNNNNTINVASSTPDCTEDKKEESKNTPSSNIPVMSYATGFQPVDGNAVFPPPGGGPYPTTTYQSAPDGSVYAVPQPMVYAYPPPMEGEIQGYFMPVYDQTGQRDTNGLVPAPAQAIYQPAGGAAAVVPVAYPTAPFSGAPIYPGQVVYSPDQFAQSASTAGQVQQYQMTYPVGYPYTYNGYWGQTMTYYVPQPPLGNTVPPGLIPPPLPPSGTSTSIGSHGSSNCSSGKRSSPPQQSLSSGPNSQTATPANTYQFAPGVPLTLTSDPNGPTMYAIPQPAVFPNMLPYGPQSTPSATSGVLTSVPPHQPNAVISPLISHQAGPAGPHIQMDPSSTVYNVTNTNGNHANSNGTPQSGSGTPLSNPLPLPHPQRNQPLFATPPIIPNGYNAPLQNHYQSYTDSQNIGNSHYEKKNSMNSANKKGNGGYIPNGRQNSYAGNQQRKPTADNSNIPTNQNGTNRQMHMTQQKRGNDKNQSSGGIVNSNTMGGNNAQNNSDKPRTGVRPKPGNLDLRRSASQRNSPSTNSLESNNNSPNSIASNHLTGGYSADHPQSMYMTRGTHIPPMHPPTAAAVVAAAAAAANDAAACHQPLIGAYNHPAPAGMYIKYGQAYFTHPPVALPNNRRSPPNELRPPLTPLTGMYSTVNMMLPAPRQMQPRHPNPNYKGNKPSR